MFGRPIPFEIGIGDREFLTSHIEELIDPKGVQVILPVMNSHGNVVLVVKLVAGLMFFV